MDTLIRCNHCMTVMVEDADTNIVQCAKCGKDDALMQDFISEGRA